MKTTLTVLLTVICLLASLSKSFPQAANGQDSIALVNLYDSTNGAGWKTKTNWLSAQPLSTWYGVTTVSGRVTNLDLSNNNLVGSIPTSIGNFSNLQQLKLIYNQLTGSIPSEIGNLTNLIIFDVSGNQLTGNIPVEIGNLSNLEELHIDLNQLTGSIPSELGNLLNLKICWLRNQLTGSIPSSLGNLAQLQQLELSENQLTGSIPSSLGNLSQLILLALDRNQLSGNIPSSLGNLSNLTTLNLAGNKLSGTVPLSFNNLSAAYISIHANDLTFSGMEQFASNNTGSYSPQAPIPLYNQNNTLSVAAGGTPSNDTFRLYRNGVLDTMQIGDSTFPITATGKYNMVVTNSIAIELTLYTDTLDIASLPITLSSFAASKKQTSVLLNWQTANEQNNAFFAIERSNNGNSNFSEVGRVNSKGNSNKPQQYSFQDLSPFSDGNYYRLKQVDGDGKTTYSKVVFIDFSKPVSIKLYPNPVRDVLTIEGLQNTNNISIISLQGSVLAKATASGSTYAWNIKQLPAGTYYLRIEAGKNVTALKFIKE